MKRVIYLFFFSVLCINVSAQEINARLSVNSSKVQSVDRLLVESLEKSINTLLNERKWTEANFSTMERIECVVAIAIEDMPTPETLNCEIQVTARRPVYNANYLTPLLNFKDNKLSFSYTMGESLEYNNYSVQNNLVATIAYYVYVILGLDFDSFSLNGGRPYFTKAMEIANSAQALNTKGWEPFSGKVNRYDLAVALTNESLASFHSAWYNYHRLGLDIMESNVDRGRIRIVEALTELEKVYESNPSSPLLAIFGDAKVDEIIRICSKSKTEEKEKVKKLLLKFFPAKGRLINELK